MTFYVLYYCCKCIFVFVYFNNNNKINMHKEDRVFNPSNQIHEAKKVALNSSQRSTLASILTSLSGDKKHAVKRAVDSKASLSG